MNGAVLAFTAAAVLITGIITGLLPALRTRITDLAGVLKQGSKGSNAPSRQRTHNALVISEVAMALVLLTGAGLLLRSLQHLLEVSPGFGSDHLLMMDIPHAIVPFADYAKLSPEDQVNVAARQSLEFEQIVAQVRALPGARAAGGISELPLGTVLRSASRFVIDGRPLPDVGARPIAQTRDVSLGYFSTMGISILSGRSFVQEDWKLQNIVINQTMARRYWPGGDALGKRINLCSLGPKPCWFPIIGIVADVHQFGLEAAPTYDVYYTGGWTEHLVVHTETDPASLVSAITRVVHTVDPKLPVTHVMTMDELLSGSVSQRRVSAELLVIFAVVALILAAIGIYGVLSYAVSQRTQEIGIRMAVGAQRSDVQKMILGHTLKLTIMGIIAGSLASLGLNRFLTSLLFGVKSHDPATLAGVCCLLTLVALAAAYVPVRRAIGVDPLAALRCE